MAAKPNIGNVGFRHNIVTATKTRPANTTAYAANDVISESATDGQGTCWTFSNISPDARNGKFEIIKATILTDAASKTPQLTLHLFKATPTGELDDNSANTGPLAADWANYVGAIDFPALESLGASISHATVTRGTVGGLPLPVTLGETAHLYGVLITRDALTPTSGEIFTIILETKVD